MKVRSMFESRVCVSERARTGVVCGGEEWWEEGRPVQPSSTDNAPGSSQGGLPKIKLPERYMDEPEALCVCKETQVACGSNNKTYDSVCQMNQEAADSGFPNTLYLKHWGPCRSVPWIISGPQDVGSSLGQGLALDCEVKGYPIPSIHWEFKADDGTSRMLPSDDLYMAVQVRGGPEPYMATSWVQIVSLRHKDTGTYTCVATNTEGVVRASAQVGVRG
uniref:Kazal-type serine protease inhibitor domain-containing protein 1 n=1 Tax=Timema genevievae TaxID=629358 RepID=A0A7R9JQV0_TIMGE|nr:unnamed protein product [Timema genevievae]